MLSKAAIAFSTLHDDNTKILTLSTCSLCIKECPSLSFAFFFKDRTSFIVHAKRGSELCFIYLTLFLSDSENTVKTVCFKIVFVIFSTTIL